MRDYLSLGNLWKAVLLGAAVTVMSIPRMIQGGMPLELFVPLALFCMTLVCGAASAWGDKGGLCGLFPGWRRTGIGLGIAAIVTIIAAPLTASWLDPAMRAAIEASGDEKALALAYPESAAGKLAAMLWSGSFHVMFLVVAAMSFMARLTRKVGISVGLVVVLRSAVALYKLQHVGVTDGAVLFVVLSAAETGCSCLLFARTGLVPVVILAMGLDLHLFL